MVQEGSHEPPEPEGHLPHPSQQQTPCKLATLEGWGYQDAKNTAQLLDVILPWEKEGPIQQLPRMQPTALWTDNPHRSKTPPQMQGSPTIVPATTDAGLPHHHPPTMDTGLPDHGPPTTDVGLLHHCPSYHRCGAPRPLSPHHGLGAPPPWSHHHHGHGAPLPSSPRPRMRGSPTTILATTDTGLPTPAPSPYITGHTSSSSALLSSYSLA